MFRIGQGGVEANRNSPDWHRDNEPLGIARVPPQATPDAPPRWERVSRGRFWEWFDHRLHPGGKPLGEWSIPIRAGTRSAAIRGRSQASVAKLSLRLDRGSEISGVTLKLIPEPTASLALRNDGERPVTILGTRGEVFARVGPRGVEVNVHSPVWLPTGQHRNRNMLDWVIDPEATPEMELITTRPELVWPDPRLLPDRQIPSGVTEATEVANWSIPLRVGGTPGNATALEGVTMLDPVAGAEQPTSTTPVQQDQPTAVTEDDDDGSLATILVAGLALAAIVGVGVGLARRR